MEEYKSNSHKSKEEPKRPAKKTDKVVSGSVTTKRNEVRKFTDIFMAGDLASVGSFLWRDVTVPAVKRLIEDLTINGVSKVLWGGDVPARGSGGYGSGMPKVSYSSYYDKKDPRSPREETRVSTRFDYDDLVYASRGDAEMVLMQMDEMLDRFRVVTVLDMYDAAGKTAPFTADKYGWSDLHEAKVVPVRGGYVVKLPRAYPVD